MMRPRFAIWAAVFGLIGAGLMAQQAKSPRDPQMIDAAGFQKILAQHRGQALLVNFWATWCEPCRDEYPMLNELAKQYGPKGLSVVGVSMDDDGDIILMRRFLTRYRPIFTNYRKTAGDDAGFRQSVLAGWTGTLPITIFYGKDGKQAGSFIGEKPRDQYERAIQGLLAEGASAQTK